MLFYTNPFAETRNYQVNTLDVYLFNPVYRDGKGVGISIDLEQHNSTHWEDVNKNVTVATFYKKRISEECTN